MSKKANPAVIGTFVVGAVFLAVFCLFVFGSKQFIKEKKTFVLYFSDSVNGLEVGAPVKFKGVDVGQVSKILLHFDKDKMSAYVPVEIDIACKHLRQADGVNWLDVDSEEAYDYQLKNGLKARLESESYVTGKLFIELDYLPKSPIKLVEIESPYLQIPTVPSELDQVWTSATDLFKSIGEIDFASTFAKIDSVVAKLDAQLQDVSLAKIQTSVVDAFSAVESFSTKIDSQVDPIAEDLRAALQQAERAFEDFENFSEELDEMLDANSPFRDQLDRTLEEFEGAARSVRRLADSLERNPKSLIFGKKTP